MVDLNEIGKQAKAAAGVLAITPTEQKDRALLAIADALRGTSRSGWRVLVRRSRCIPEGLS